MIMKRNMNNVNLKMKTMIINIVFSETVYLVNIDYAHMTILKYLVNEFKE